MFLRDASNARLVICDMGIPLLSLRHGVCRDSFFGVATCCLFYKITNSTEMRIFPFRDPLHARQPSLRNRCPDNCGSVGGNARGRLSPLPRSYRCRRRPWRRGRPRFLPHGPRSLTMIMPSLFAVGRGLFLSAGCQKDQHRYSCQRKHCPLHACSSSDRKFSRCHVSKRILLSSKSGCAHLCLFP